MRCVSLFLPCLWINKRCKGAPSPPHRVSGHNQSRRRGTVVGIIVSPAIALLRLTLVVMTIITLHREPRLAHRIYLAAGGGGRGRGCAGYTLIVHAAFSGPQHAYIRLFVTRMIGTIYIPQGGVYFNNIMTLNVGTTQTRKVRIISITC